MMTKNRGRLQHTSLKRLHPLVPTLASNSWSWQTSGAKKMPSCATNTRRRDRLSELIASPADVCKALSGRDPASAFNDTAQFP